MADPQYLQFWAAIIGAILGAVASTIVNRLADHIWPPSPLKRRKPRNAKTTLGKVQTTDQAPLREFNIGQTVSRWIASIRQSRASRTLFILAVLLSIGALIGSNTGRQLLQTAATIPTAASSPTPIAGQSATVGSPKPTPTTMARGELIMVEDFRVQGSSHCDTYDPSILGYESGKYYIAPQGKGYLAVCNFGIQLPEGSLEVKAYPSGTSDEFGYGLFFGWKGGGLTTTDFCSFGINRAYLETDSKGTPQLSTQATFLQVSGGQWMRVNRPISINLDTRPHSLRMVLERDGSVTGYLDDTFVESYKFDDCQSGPVGLIGWGKNDTKIFFDDLKLFSLP